MTQEWYSQAGQDEWVYRLIGDHGFFVDLGAYDGVQTSNSLGLEQKGWTGICVEANRDYFSALVANRPKTLNVNVAVSDHVGELHFRDQWVTDDITAPLIPCLPISDILDRAFCPPKIDYLSLDIEGVEYDALRAFNFSMYTIDLITVEHNLYCDGPFNKDRIFALLSANGFVRVVEDAPCLDAMYYGMPYEDWYRNAECM